ncbi:DUF4424 domain-containing protein [Pseudomonas sp. R2.Fl]|nr:DUF4424 domain-containing protein [Pseudomonas sp. R2.Fl]
MARSILAFAMTAAIAGPALANDTMAELKAGGLVYVRTSDVTMAEEDLHISPTKVSVDYVFRNEGDKDVESVVAFPMPDIRGGPDMNIAVPDFDADNFLGFSVTQDGKPIEPELQQRALSAAGVDLTEELVAKGVPLLPFSEATTAALEKLPPDVLSDWQTRGLVMEDVFDAGSGWENHPMPVWTLRSVYHWKTVFPAGKDVRVHHEYTPGVGGTVAISFLLDGEPNDYNFEDYRTRFCMDDAFVRLATKLDKASREQTGPYFTEQWISYVLTTGANWAGAIGKFRLTVDKGAEKNFVSFCGEGVKKTGPTTFEMTATDFYPQKDLDILLLVPGE